MSDLSQHNDIIIVGAGPSGLAFARYFHGTDIRITIVERADRHTLENPSYDGREIALTHRSKEILQNLGVWQRIDCDEIYPLKDAKVYNGSLNYALHFQVPPLTRATSSIDRLGHLISNHHIRRCVYQEVSQMPNVTLITGVSVTDVINNNQKASVLLSDGRQLNAKLLIAADSRLSTIRRQLGIGSMMNDFGRTVIVFRVRHPISNQATAQECFLDGRTLAILPLNEYLSNCVITLENTAAKSLLALSDEDLAKVAQRMMQDKLGTLTPAGSIHHYPLMGVHAHRFYAQRAALIGDAAVGMHPVTAHGYNLGLQSADILASLILKAHAQGQDIGSQALLSRYNTKHQRHTRILYHGTNAMVELFTSDAKPMQLVRHLALRASNHLPPIKHWISKQLTG